MNWMTALLIFRKKNDKYQKRPEELEAISLAQFVSKYTKINKGEYVRKQQPRVIRYKNYDMTQDYNE